jgi:hypothetical protein
MTTWMIKKLTMLILNMAFNFMFVFDLKNYKCDNPNNPLIHAFIKNTLQIWTR